MRSGIGLALVVCGFLGPRYAARADTYVFTTIEVPNARYTGPAQINNLGQIVGTFNDGAGKHGFVETNGVFTAFDFGTTPFGGTTQGDAINDTGQIVGTSDSGSFLYANGTFTPIIYPGLATSTFALGINDAGQITGMADATGFLDTNGVFSMINVPGAILTSGQSINNQGKITGFYLLAGSLAQGFIDDAGVFTTIDAPGATTGSGAIPGTFLGYMNDSGQIMGFYTDDTGLHSFLYSDGIFTAINVPGALSTYASGINDAGQFVGTYTDSAGVQHGFLATPVPEPAPLALFALGVTTVVGMIRLKRSTHRRQIARHTEKQAQLFILQRF